MHSSRQKASYTPGSHRKIFSLATLSFISLVILFYCFCLFGQRKSNNQNVVFLPVKVKACDFGCGQTALMTVAKAHGDETTAKLRSLLTENHCLKGSVTSFYDLANWSEAVGMKPIGIKIDSKDLGELPTPAIVHTTRNHFLALMSVDDKQVVVIDQGVSKYSILRCDFEEMFSGYALCFR